MTPTLQANLGLQVSESVKDFMCGSWNAEFCLELTGNGDDRQNLNLFKFPIQFNLTQPQYKYN